MTQETLKRVFLESRPVFMTISAEDRDKRWRSWEHKHDYVEFMYVTGGKGVVVLGKSEILIEQGSLVTIAPGALHVERIAEDHFLRAVWLGVDWRDRRRKRLAIPASCTDMHLGIRNPVEGVMRRILEESAARQFGWETAVSGLLSEFACHLARFQVGEQGEDGRGSREPERNNKTVLEAIRYIETHYSEALSLRSISKIFLLTPGYFGSLFKARSGFTPIEYLTRVRIDRARAKLRDSALSITNVARAVGYHSVHYFTNVFTRIEGVSPREYRDKG